MDNSWKNNNLLIRMNEGARRTSLIEDVPLRVPVIVRYDKNESTIVNEISKEYGNKYSRCISPFDDSWTQYAKIFSLPRGYLLGYVDEENKGDLFDTKFFHIVGDRSICQPFGLSMTSRDYRLAPRQVAIWAKMKRGADKLSSGLLDYWKQNYSQDENYLVKTRSLDEFSKDVQDRAFGVIEQFTRNNYGNGDLVPCCAYNGCLPIMGRVSWNYEKLKKDPVFVEALKESLSEEAQKNFITTVTIAGEGIPLRYFNAYKLAEERDPRLKALVEDII